MEANSSTCTCNSVVREALNENNYEMWSSYMEDYLLGQDLWDVIIESEPEETDQSSPDSSKNIIKIWRKNNALALHAIKMSCGPNLASKIVTVKSAKEAWDLLAASAAGSEKGDVDDGEKDVEEDQSTGSEDDDDDNDDDDEEEEEINYEPLIKAAREEDWPGMEKFLDSHPKAVTAKVFDDDGTLIHYLIDDEQEKNVALLLNRLEGDELEITNELGYTALAVAADEHYPGLLQLLKVMVAKNPKLPNIGTPSTLPAILAALNGFKDTARFLYSVTDKSVLDPESGKHGVSLLINCIESKIFDIASKLVEEFPKILRQSDSDDEDDDDDEENGDNNSDTNKEEEKGKEDKENEDGTYPICTLAKTFSALSNENRRHKKLSRLKQWWSDVGEWIMTYVYLLLGIGMIPKESYDEELIFHQARAFLQQVCVQVSTFDIETLVEAAYDAMVEAAIRGNIEFITKMLTANPNLIWAHNNSLNMFWHAVKNRHEKVFNLIYDVIERKNTLLSCPNEEDNNIIHLVAMLAPTSILDRTAGPALQVQKELQWFQEVWNVANPRDREELNKEKLTPRELFTKSHEKLIDAGEKAMKDTAQSSTVVGALIVTIMFAAAFTVPGGNNQNTGYPVFVSDALFKIFIVCDALSLYSSATSVLIFLGILTSRYAEDDFLVLLPRKLILGVSTLFFSIATMMVTFCAALAIMLNGRLQFIFPIVLLAFVPVILFLSSIFPLLSKIYYSTFGPSMFDKNTKLPSKTDFKKIMHNPTKVTDRPNRKEDTSMRKNPPSVASEEKMNNSSRIDQIV